MPLQKKPQKIVTTLPLERTLLRQFLGLFRILCSLVVLFCTCLVLKDIILVKTFEGTLIGTTATKNNNGTLSQEIRGSSTNLSQPYYNRLYSKETGTVSEKETATSNFINPPLDQNANQTLTQSNTSIDEEKQPKEISKPLVCPRRCPNNKCSANQVPRIPKVSVNGKVLKKSSTYYSKNWGNVLAPYWAARAMAAMGGYEYKGGVFGRGTWMEYLPISAPAKYPNKESFDKTCDHCVNYEFFHKWECSDGWSEMAPLVMEGTRKALLEYSEKKATAKENDEIFNFFLDDDWLVYNRCCVLGHPVHVSATISIYDSIPKEGVFNIYIMMGRKEDPFNFCDVFTKESIDYMAQRNPSANITVLNQSTLFVDFARLVFAPNLLVASAGSSWVLFSAIYANNNNVVTPIPVLHSELSAYENLDSLHIRLDVPVIENPLYSKEFSQKIGLPMERFSNTTEDRGKILKFFLTGV